MSQITHQSQFIPVTGSFERDVAEMLRNVVGHLEPGIATLDLQPSRDPAGGDDIQISPRNADSASIFVHVIGDTAYMCLGRNSRSEVLSGSSREKEALQTILQMSMAVIDGRFSEDLWFLDDKIVKSVGTLKLEGKTGRLRYVGVFNPLRAKQKQHYDYSPYSATRRTGAPGVV
jgi:hypothetical protein